MFLLGLLHMGLASQVYAQNFTSAAVTAETDLKVALTELAELQASIAEEKIPMARRMNQLEEEVLSARKELERVQRSRDNQLVDLNVLKSEVKARNDEVAYITGLLSEYARLFESRIHISETAAYQETINDAQASSQNQDLSISEKLDRQLAMVEIGLNRVESLSGGHIFPGKALSQTGVFEDGKFLIAGPVCVFASNTSDSAGVADVQLGSPEPTVMSMDPAQVSQIRKVVEGEGGLLPVDTTMGNALKIAATQDTFFDHLKKGGPVMVPLLGLGFIALVIAIFKWIELSKINVAQPRDLHVILSHLDESRKDEALKHASGIKGIVGEMLTSAIEHAHDKKEYIEEIMYETMLSTKPKLERLLPIIALTAATAPLLGLLGTVTGMINTFNLITVFGTGDPRTLSGGISEALITTKFGLIVAVPALLLHALISRKAKSILGSMEQITVGFINGLPSGKQRKELL